MLNRVNAGAVEVWIVSEAGGWQIFDVNGPRFAGRNRVQLASTGAASA
jgi:hypothetical protein